MRILIDLQGAQNGSRNRGIGRYCMALAKAIARNCGDHQIFILLNGLFLDSIDSIRSSFSGLLPEHHIIVFNVAGPVDELRHDNAWRLNAAELLREAFVRDLAPDFLLIGSLFEGGNDNTVSSVGRLHSKVPTAVVLYDLIPHLDPEKYLGWAPAKKWYYNKIESLKRADLLLAISNSARCEAIDHLDIDPTSLVNISSAADTTFVNAELAPSERAIFLSRFGIKRRYLMHTSALDERKNFEGLIRAFGALPQKLRKQYQLVLVCKIDETGRKSLRNVTKTAGLRDDDVILTGYVTDEELINLYSESYLFVFPSFHEGFGLPALEAMCCGIPVIGSNTSSIPEVIGRDDALFDPKSTDSIASLIEKVLTDQRFYNDLKAHAAVQSKKFSWDRSAKLAIEAFEKVRDNLRLRRTIHDRSNADDLINDIFQTADSVQPSELDLVNTANSIFENENSARLSRAYVDFGGQLKWRIEGPFDSTYSLALLNRETARALDQLGHKVILHSTEGPGDFQPNPAFLAENPDLASMNERVGDYPHSLVDVASRNLYPPRVQDMRSPLNLLHHYAWEESGFPQEWVFNFNASLDGLTCLSNHVEKIMVDNGVAVPMLTSGCGVDHWERIQPASTYHLKAKRFRFLHVSSCFPRKGVDLLLDAYGKSFSANDDVTLVIKTFENQHNEIHKWLAERQAENSAYPDVAIVEGDLTDSQLKALYQQCHVLVSPSRAEGFGLPMAEAMLSGLPVITTAWGGQLDFCNDDNSWLVDYEFERAKTHFGLFSSVWAKIDVNSLADVLIKARNSDPEQLKSMALSGRALLMERFKWVDVVARAVEAAQIWRNHSNDSPNARIGWITTWNTKCGIAGYSKHLVSHMPECVKILAPYESTLVQPDEDNCIRCWYVGKENNHLYGAANYAREEKLNTLVIQFNFGFFNHRELATFIEQQLDEGRVVIMMMHSTLAPEFSPSWNFRLEEIQHVLMRCQRILVHSVSDLNRLKAIGLVENVMLFPHGVLNYATSEPKSKKGNFPLIASYGFCLPNKGLQELVEAIGILKTQGRMIRLRLVNAEFPSPESTQLIQRLERLVKTLKVDDLVEMYPAFLPDDQSLSLLSDADLLVFAYQHSGESSSAAVRYGLATQRPIAVTPLSIFEDIGSAAFRFAGTSVNDIAQGIVESLQDLSTLSDKATTIQVEAQRWRDQHDYSALSKRLFNVCSALVLRQFEQKFYFQGSNPQLRTVVGKISGRDLISTRTAGNLIHGPYISLNAGAYRIVIRGALGENGASGAHAEVTIDKGARVLEELGLSASDEHGILAAFLIGLDKPCIDLEVRVWVNDDTDVRVSMIEIAPWKTDQEGVHTNSGKMSGGDFQDDGGASNEPVGRQELAQVISLAPTASQHIAQCSNAERNQEKTKRKKKR